MRGTKYSCPNGCKLPPRRKELREIEKGVWGFKYNDFRYCPNCGALMPETLRVLKSFFSVYNLHPALRKAERLLYKSEFDSAARESFVVVETILREKSGLDLHGQDLVVKALNFEIDKNTKEIAKEPLIAINKLETDSEINEQEGLRFALMGFFHGARNIFQHNSVPAGVLAVITIIMEASYFLERLDGHSITKKGKWIHHYVKHKEIYDNMPKFTDRVRFRIYLWRKRNN